MTTIRKTLVKASRTMIASAAMVSLLGTVVPVFAATNSFETSRGPAYITGNFGSTQTTTLPGGAGEGFLENNGNGTSTLIGPGQLPQVVATPR